MRSDVYGNCLNVINNGSACSVLFLSTPGLFSALRKTLEDSTASRALKLFLHAGNNPVVLKNSTEHAEPLFIALVEYVLDGGELLQRLPWKRDMTYSAICDLYVDYVERKYKTAAVVFDGYQVGPSPKDTTRKRRTGRCTGTAVKFTEQLVLTLKKEQFVVFHAEGDAGLLIVLSETSDIAVIGDDTDLLVLLLYYGRNLSLHDIYFRPKPNNFARKKSTNISTLTAVRNLGVNLCENILSIHALLGCDTTSILYGLGKG